MQKINTQITDVTNSPDSCICLYFSSTTKNSNAGNSLQINMKVSIRSVGDPTQNTKVVSIELTKNKILTPM